MTETATQTPDALDLVGGTEIADRYDVSPQLVNEWAKTATFPTPIRHLRAGRVWNGHAVAAWVADHRPERVAAA